MTIPRPLKHRGKHLEFLHDTASAIDLEGGLASGKTTVCLDKEISALIRYPGMSTLVCRWTDDANNKLMRPAIEQMARIHRYGIEWQGDKAGYYTCENRSRIYSFGLKTQSQEPEQRYGKIRGFIGSRIYVDQAEQLPPDIAGELILRLRPDLEQRLRGEDLPRQLTFSPNPVNFEHWLAKQFPADNSIDGRRYYALSLFDNEHNLPPDVIANALRDYPPTHPKHTTMILGQRGMTVIGDPIYDDHFDRDTHVQALTASDDVPFIEAIEFGKHNPVWVLAQRSHYGALNLLGGIVGVGMLLDDFLPVIKHHRREWTPRTPFPIRTTCSSAGETEITKARYTLVRLLREEGFVPVFQDNSNAHDVQLAMIETIGMMLRRRTKGREEALAVNSDPARWLYAFPDGTLMQRPFMAFAFEGGYVWSTHTVSVANKEMRQPEADDEYANVMRAVENLTLNFVAGQRTDESREARRRKAVGAPSSFDPEGSPHDWMRG